MFALKESSPKMHITQGNDIVTYVWWHFRHSSWWVLLWMSIWTLVVTLEFRWAVGSEGLSCKERSSIVFNKRSSRQKMTLEFLSVAFFRTLLQGRPPHVLQEWGVLRGKGHWISIFEKADTESNLNPWLRGYLGMRREKGDAENLHSMGSGSQGV